MRIQSPLSNLRDVLAQVKDAAKTHSTTLTNNEDATRAALIDPVLRALGWDTAQVNMVEVEKTAKGARADYALRDTSGVQVIIEAKKLNDNLSQHALGLINDAYAFQVSSVFLTNGLVWQHFTSFAPQGFRPFKEYDLENDDLGEIAAYLVHSLDAANFWPEEQGVDVLAQDVAQLRSDVNTLQQQIANIVGGETPHDPKDDDDPPTFGGIDLDSLVVKKFTRPIQLHLPDGRVTSVQHWSVLLTECCKYALMQSPSLPIPLRDFRQGGNVNLIDLVPPPDNIHYVAVPSQGRTVYIRTTYSAADSVANANHILALVSTSKAGAKAAVILK